MEQRPVEKTREARRVKVRTSTIRVRPPATFDQLERQYKLVRYVVPDRLRTQRDGTTFARVHADLREQLDYPYKSYKHDKLDAAKRWAVYVLYPEAKQPLDLNVHNAPMEWRVVSFNDVELHVLLKLLQVEYFHGGKQGKFVGSDKCYIYARPDGKNAYVCMEIELKGDLANRPEQSCQLFKVIGSAHKLVRVAKPVQPGRQYSQPYFAISRLADQMVFFRQLKPSEVVKASQSGTVYEERTFKGRRTTLDYHSLDAVEQSRGYLIHTFIEGFATFLSQYGLQVDSEQREFVQFTPTSEVTDFELPLALLGSVGLFDVRLQRNIPLEHYRTLFESHFPDVKFEMLATLNPHYDKPVIFLMDYVPEAFDEGMPLEGERDPYRQLYEHYPHLPKQGINANQNDVASAEGYNDARAWYLDYPPLDGDDRGTGNQLATCMNELFLKDVVLHDRAFSERLPFVRPADIFVRKVSRNISSKGTRTISFEVALWLKGDTLQFLNLGNPEQRNQFTALLETMGIDWWANIDAMAERYLKTKSEKLSHYDVVISPDLFVEIETLNERTLYEFDEILARQKQQKASLPLADFKLAHRYYDLKSPSMLSRLRLIHRGLLDADGMIIRPGNTDREIASLMLWSQLQEYDAILDEMALEYPEISFEDLCRNDVWLPRLAEALGRERNTSRQNHSRYIRGIYRRLDIFPSYRQGQLAPTYQGIWHDEDHRYIVGDVYSLKPTGQAKAHLVRQFVVYQGHEEFEIQGLLDAMSVRFVRLNQYTVYPFFFHLIDIYIDNVLQHGETDQG